MHGTTMNDNRDNVCSSEISKIKLQLAPGEIWQLGKYDILKTVGKGASGIVYKARSH